MKKDIRRFEEFIRTVKQASDMPISHVAYLSACYRNPSGITYQDLEAETGMPFSTIARTAKVLGTYLDKDKKGNTITKGLGFVKKEINPENTKQYLVVITEGGKRFVEKLINALDSI